jgi:hypothetical protein
MRKSTKLPPADPAEFLAEAVAHAHRPDDGDDASANDIVAECTGHTLTQLRHVIDRITGLPLNVDTVAVVGVPETVIAELTIAIQVSEVLRELLVQHTIDERDRSLGWMGDDDGA